MPEIIDLSTLKDKKPTLEDLPEDTQERLAAMADETELDTQHVRTAFLVVVDTDGSINVQPDLDIELARDHLPNMDEVYSAVKVVAKDIEVQETAMHTAQLVPQVMQQVAMAQMEAIERAKVAQQLQQAGLKRR